MQMGTKGVFMLAEMYYLDSHNQGLETLGVQSSLDIFTFLPDNYTVQVISEQNEYKMQKKKCGLQKTFGQVCRQTFIMRNQSEHNDFNQSSCSTSLSFYLEKQE